MLNILYKDEHDTSEDLTFVEVLDKMRNKLKEDGYTQIPQVRDIVILRRFTDTRYCILTVALAHTLGHHQMHAAHVITSHRRERKIRFGPQ